MKPEAGWLGMPDGLLVYFTNNLLSVRQEVAISC